MTDPLQLTHLTFLGSRPTASLEFGPGLNVVSGPSDTGKSFIVDAIDFMLGASALKQIPEREGYTLVLLGLRNAEGQHFTLERPVAGGAIGLRRGELRGRAETPPTEVLAAKHSAKNTTSLSRFLLGQVGLDQRLVRKNVRAETRSLSFRDLAHLCVVDETQMQAETAPAVSGSYVGRTAELSVFKLLLQDQDDSDLASAVTSAESGRSISAKIELLDRLIGEVEDRLHDEPDEASLRDQLHRLESTISDFSSAQQDLLAERSQEGARAQEVQNNRSLLSVEVVESRALLARFGLLAQQYDNDLSRLELIAEAGNLLGYFDVDVCPFCGAEPDHQHAEIPDGSDLSAFGAAVQAEREKTRALRDDLGQTMRELGDRMEALRQRDRDLTNVETRARRRVEELDEELRPHQSELQELLEERSKVQSAINLHEQIDSLARVRAELDVDDQVADTAVASELSLSSLREFSTVLVRHLSAWGYPGADTVRYDRNDQDIVANDQLRAAHGKGVRAVLHAAFSVALADYCFDKQLPHPGFVVLDSPLVTYRAPDRAARSDPGLPDNFASLFYRDLENSSSGQVLVLENVAPPDDLSEETRHVAFTKSATSGRYGFFPTGP